MMRATSTRICCATHIQDGSQYLIAGAKSRAAGVIVLRMETRSEHSCARPGTGGRARGEPSTVIVGMRLAGKTNRNRVFPEARLAPMLRQDVEIPFFG